MKHYKNLMSALGDAMPVCLAWRLAGTEDNFFNARDLFAFALSDDKAEGEGSLKEGQFYVVSAEGAIGISSGYEYFVRWLFIPIEGGRYDLEVMRLKRELENDAKPESTPQTIQKPQPVAQPQPAVQTRPVTQPQPAVQPRPAVQARPAVQPQPAVKPQPAIQPQSTPQETPMRFCMHCGAQLNATAKFCGRCGAPVSR